MLSKEAATRKDIRTARKPLTSPLTHRTFAVIAGILRELGQEGYVVPRPHHELVTRRVLVMERLSGFNFDDVVGMRSAGIDMPPPMPITTRPNNRAGRLVPNPIIKHPTTTMANPTSIMRLA